MIDRRIRSLVPLSALLVVAACGDEELNFQGSSADTFRIAQPPAAAPPPPPPPPPPEEGTVVILNSDTGDYVGQGLDYTYTLADSEISITVESARLTIDIEGDENWRGDFQLPDDYNRLETGSYPNLTRYPFHNAIIGGLDWSGEGRGCNTLDATMTIDSVVYDGDTLTDIELSFEQYCEGNSPALRGQIRWDADDPTTPPGPASRPPGELWAPVPGTTPDTGNYVVLVSEQGDFVGGGSNYLYTDETAVITVGGASGRASVAVEGAESWRGEFQAMNVIPDLEVGYYGDLQRYPFHNPVKGGLSWTGEGRGCNRLEGWFNVDSVTYTGDTLTSIELRFRQNCEGNTSGLLGAIRWSQ